jgi:CRP-like cAMP-binding protein
MNCETLAHAANLLFGAAYIVRGIFWLRVLSIIACVIMAFFNYYAPEQPLWVAVYWNLFFSAVNAIQVWQLIRERSAVVFTVEEEELYETMFRQMSAIEFMKIVRLGCWETMDPGTTLIHKNSEVSEIRLVCCGTVIVDIDNDTRIELKKGAFLGELAFVSGGLASGEVSTLTKTRVISWPFDELRRLFRCNPEIRSGFQSLISCDLATKLILPSRIT